METVRHEVDVEYPGTIALQPRPVEVRTAQVRVDRGAATAIYRAWAPGDVARCRLCPNCSAYRDACLIVVGQLVSKESGATFSTWGMRMTFGVAPRFGCVALPEVD
jgi:hypothetical protein